MKNALVTGVSWTTGIGFAISKQLIEDGFYVYAIYHSEDSTAKDFYDQKPSNITFLQCDLSRRDAIYSLINYFKNSNISLDVIVNNAGAFGGGEDIDDYDLEMWDRVLAVNVTAPLTLAVGLKSQMNKNGVIINMISTDGMKGSFSSIAYAASKAALINLTDSLAINFGYDEKKFASPLFVRDGLSPLMKQTPLPLKWFHLFQEVLVLSYVRWKDLQKLTKLLM